MSIGMLIALEAEANQLKSFAIGGLAFLILIGAMVVLVTIGGGREHS